MPLARIRMPNDRNPRLHRRVKVLEVALLDLLEAIATSSDTDLATIADTIRSRLRST